MLASCAGLSSIPNTPNFGQALNLSFCVFFTTNNVQSKDRRLNSDSTTS